MARKTPAPPQPVPANLPAARVPEAITKLERRLADFEAADPTKINGELYYAAEALCNKLSSTLDDIYGPGTIEKDRVETSAHGFIRVVMGGVSRHEQIEAFQRGRARAVSRIKAELEILRERIEDTGHDVVGHTPSCLRRSHITPRYR